MSTPSTSLPDGAQLAVVSQSGCTLHFFDLASGRPSDVLPMVPEPHELRFDGQRRRVYVSHTYRSGFFFSHDEKSHEISVVDVDSHELVEVVDVAPEDAPHALALDAAANLLYVSVEEGPAGPGGLIALDRDSGTVTARFSADAPVPHWAVVAPDGRTAYTSNKHSPFASIIDLTGRSPVRRIPVAGSEELCLSPDGERLYIATPTTVTPDPAARNAICVVDTAAPADPTTVPLPAAPSTTHVTGGGTLLVGSWPRKTRPHRIPYADGVLSVFDATTLEPLAEIAVDVCPVNIASTPDGRTAFVANLISGTVSVVDLDTCAVVDTLTVDVSRAGGDLSRTTHNQGAHGLAYIPPRAS